MHSAEHTPQANAATALPSPAEAVSAMRHAPSIGRFAAVAILGLTIDLATKYWAFEELPQGQTRVVIPHVLEFQTLLNPGALFGIGGGHTYIFLIASVAALGLVGWMFSQTPSTRRLLQVALGAILAGALGNMYDRVTVRLVDQRYASARGVGVYMQKMEQVESGFRLEEYPPGRGGMRRTLSELPKESGFVRDFIKIPTRWMGGREVWPWVFNVADMLLVGGVIILALHLWTDRHDVPRPAAAEPSG